MTGFFYYLSTNPTAYKKLQSIVDDLFPGDAEYAWEKTQNVPYIEAVINETLRLQSPASASLLRETPREGLTIDDVFVPGNVVISVPTYTIHRDPRYWGRPEEFIPERWTDQPELCKDKRAFIPFTLGKYLLTIPPLVP